MNQKIFFFLLVLAFVLIRLPATSFPLHQDEYKWPLSVNPANINTVAQIPHPPLGEFIYRMAGYIVGFNTDFRFVPLLFGSLNLLLLCYFVKFTFGKREAVIAGVIWTFSYFSILASLMVDTDGQLMPFFFLLALIGYFKSITVPGKQKYKWLALLVLACIGGFFIKASFLLVIGAIFVDYLWSKRHHLSGKDILRYIVRL